PRGAGGDAPRQASSKWAEQVREAGEGPVGALITELAVSPLPEDRPEALGGYAKGVLVALLRLGLTRQIADAKGRLQRTDPADESYGATFGELLALEDRRRRLQSEA
ncbi:MAG: DNA primase, partial [Actinomycetales bacterium]|nr:DNA primase [Actinomycetales bacterium]